MKHSDVGKGFPDIGKPFSDIKNTQFLMVFEGSYQKTLFFDLSTENDSKNIDFRGLTRFWPFGQGGPELQADSQDSQVFGYHQLMEWV